MPDIDLHAAFARAFGYEPDWTNLPGPTHAQLEAEAAASEGRYRHSTHVAADFPSVGRTPLQQTENGYQVTGAHGTYVWTGVADV